MSLLTVMQRPTTLWKGVTVIWCCWELSPWTFVDAALDGHVWSSYSYHACVTLRALKWLYKFSF